MFIKLCSVLRPHQALRQKPSTESGFPLGPWEPAGSTRANEQSVDSRTSGCTDTVTSAVLRYCANRECGDAYLAVNAFCPGKERGGCHGVGGGGGSAPAPRRRASPPWAGRNTVGLGESRPGWLRQGASQEVRKGRGCLTFSVIWILFPAW